MYVNTRKHHHNTNKERLAALGEEFNAKVQFDFTRLVFIGVQPEHVKYLSEVVELASNQNGYQSHRTITFRENICHLYVRYSTTSEAKAARDFFREQDGFYAELVDDILRGWYGYEITSTSEPRHTICYLDIVGEVVHTQPLTEDTARSLLLKFGSPIIQYAQRDHVRVAFSSIAESIGACIVYGQWFVRNNPQDPRFYYRVQLEQSDYFTQMVNHSNSTCHSKDSLQLEYFSPVTYTPGAPVFSYENTGNYNNYMSTGDHRTTKQYSRGRGQHRHQRGNKNKQRNPYPNKGRNDAYYTQRLLPDCSQIDPTIGVNLQHSSTNTSTQNLKENFR